MNRGQTEVVFIRAADHTGVGGRDDVDSTGPETPNNVAVHRILVHVQTKAAHGSYARAGKISSIAAILRGNVAVYLVELAW